MKLIRRDEAPTSSRPDGRTVRTLVSAALGGPVDSFVVYLVDVPAGGRFGAHHHTEAHEVILFPVGGGIVVNDVEYSLGPWDGVLLEPGDRHGFAGSEDAPPIVHLAIKVPDVADKVSEP